MPSDVSIVVEHHENEDEDGPFPVGNDCAFDGAGQGQPTSVPASRPLSRGATLFFLFVGAVAVTVVAVPSSSQQHQHQNDHVPAAATASTILIENQNINSIKIMMEDNEENEEQGQPGDGVRLLRRKFSDSQKHHMTAVMDEFETLRKHWLTATAKSTTTDAASATTDDQQQHQPGKPFFGDGNQLHVLQIGDEKYRKAHKERMSVNRDWTKCAEYQYDFKSFENDDNVNNDDDTNSGPATPPPKDKQTEDQPPCVSTKKVKAIRDFLANDIPLNDWMIFVDLDANYQSPDCPALEKLLWKEQHHYTSR
jgi:hypothetical protein